MDSISTQPNRPVHSRTNAELTSQAREMLRGHWKFGALVTLIYVLISVTLSRIPIVGEFILLILNGAFSLGLAIIFLSLVRKDQPKLDQLFEGFSRFKVAFLANLLTYIFFILWSVLLIIPGIMAWYSYAMTFFILADEPHLSAIDAISKSKQIMYGNRWKFCCLGLRFVPWALLCIPTLGIGVLWILPYLYTSMALFYEDVKS